MIYLKTDEEIEKMRVSNQMVAKTLAEVAKEIKEGVSTLYLDKIAEDFIRSMGGKPSFLGYCGYPNSLCISINETVVHGIPSDKIIVKDGDVVSVDCGTILKGFYGDSAYTFAVGDTDMPKEYTIDVNYCRSIKFLCGGKEIVITGVNIGDFGQGTDKRFIDLICELDKIDGIERYRISSIEPDLLTDEIIDFINQNQMTWQVFFKHRNGPFF